MTHTALCNRPDSTVGSWPAGANAVVDHCLRRGSAAAR